MEPQIAVSDSTGRSPRTGFDGGARHRWSASHVSRARPGPKLKAAERGDAVALEVEDIDEEQHTGWSVVVVGRARRLSATEQDRVKAVTQP